MKVEDLKQLLNNVTDDDIEVVVCKDEVDDTDGYIGVHKVLVVDDLSASCSPKLVIITEL